MTTKIVLIITIFIGIYFFHKWYRNRNSINMDYGAVVLDICSKRKIENPTDDEIRAELSNLSTKEQDHFAILGTSDMTYIQISGDKDVGFILEYQDGSIHEHYKAKDEDIYLEKATEAFINFRDKNPNWKTKFDFEKETW